MTAIALGKCREGLQQNAERRFYSETPVTHHVHHHSLRVSKHPGHLHINQTERALTARTSAGKTLTGFEKTNICTMF